MSETGRRPDADARQPHGSPAAGSAPLAPRAPLRESLLVLALFAALTALHTWPLAGSLGSLSRHDIADAALNEWAIAWVAHQLPRDPLDLFDANIFHPEPNTLAFSEHLFVQGLMGAPLFWAGVPSLVVHNLLILAGFALTGWAMALVMRRWTGSWMCGVLAGMLLAFNSATLTRIAHLQAVHVEFLPLAVLALDRLLAVSKVANALRLALMFAAQALTSNYLLVFTTFGIAAAGLSRASEWIGRGRARVLGLVGLAGVVAILLLAPFLLPYLEAQRQQGLTRSLGEVEHYSAAWQDYLSAVGNVHFRTWSAGLWRGNGLPLFPGITALLLTVVAFGSGVAWRNRVARMWLALGLVGLLLSFGTRLPGYELLYHAVPLLQGIRASVRFGYLALAGISALAAFGLAVLLQRLDGHPARQRAIAIAALVLVTGEVLRIPVGYSRPYQVPSAYAMLRDEPNAVVLELPLPEPPDFHLNAPYMLNSTLHWRPMLNGYSGFLPRSYRMHVDSLRAFPDGASIGYLRRLGVTHVVVHASGYRDPEGQERLAAIGRSPALRVAVQGQGLVIYELQGSAIR